VKSSPTYSDHGQDGPVTDEKETYLKPAETHADLCGNYIIVFCMTVQHF